MPSRSKWPLLIFGAFFCTCLVGAWAWFNIPISKPHAPPHVIWLTGRTSIPGYTFVDEPLDDKTRSALGADAVINGKFVPTGPGGDDSRVKRRIQVYLGSWRYNNNGGGTAIPHTPDICWIGTGWKAVAGNWQAGRIYVSVPVNTWALDFSQAYDPAPSSVSLPKTEVRSQLLPWEFRTFQAPDSSSFELVAWVMLFGGQVFSENDEFKLASHDLNHSVLRNTSRSGVAGRWLAANHSLSLTARGMKARGSKQFARISVPVGDDWLEALQEIRRFAPEWISTFSKEVAE